MKRRNLLILGGAAAGGSYFGPAVENDHDGLTKPL